MDTIKLIQAAEQSIQLKAEETQKLHELIDWIKVNEVALERFKASATLFNQQIDFDYVDRDTMLEIVKAFPGKWNKDFNSNNGKMNYSIDYDCVHLRVYGTPPPPSCVLITEEITVAEHVVPATTETRFKLDCKTVTETDAALV